MLRCSRNLARAAPVWNYRRLSTLPATVRSLLSLETPPEEDVVVHGWVRHFRKQKKFCFLDLSDGSSGDVVQVVLPSTDVASELSVGASVKLKGKLVKPDARRPHKLELHANSYQVLGECDAEVYPIQNQDLSIEHLRDHCHLRSRYPRMASTLRIRDLLFSSIHDYFKDSGFTNIHTPIITSNDCEGGGETFEATAPQEPILDPSLDLSSEKTYFFRKPAFLTVSHQLHLEAATHSFPRVYSLAPCFRAEGSQTSRHLSEFYMLEAEVAFVTSTTQLMDLVEDCVKHSLGKARASQDFETLWKDRAEELQLARFDAPWHRISYTAALKELNHKISDASVKFATPPKWGIDLHSEHERYLVDTVFRGPVFIYDYPRRIKPFYMLPNTLGAHEKTSRQTVANFDLLIPNSLELCGGSLRMHNFTQLQQAMENKKMLTHPDGSKNDAWDWYLDLRKYGSAPHGGFGLGFDRLLSWITGTGSVKDVVPMPRWAGRMLL